jgi:hypothetical protein
MKSLQLIQILACFSLFGMTAQTIQAKTTKAPAKVSNKKGDQPGPLSLVDDMRKSLIYIIQHSEEVNPKAKQTKPYWLALNAAWDGIDVMEEGIKKKDASMITGLEDTGRGITQLAASWGMIRGAYPKSTVGRGVSSLHSAYEMYQEHYGPHVARFKKKGPLTDKEKAHMAQSSKQLDGLFANLKKVNGKAKPKSFQSRMVHDIVGLINNLDRCRTNGKGRLGYASYMYQWSRLQNALWAYSEIISVNYADFYESWSILESDIEVMNTCFGNEEELFESYSEWEYTEDTIEEYDEYYEETAVVEEVEEEVSEEEEAAFEKQVEEYEEEAAVEEDEELEEESEEELSQEEEESEDSLFEEVGESYGDDDGDGVQDEEDTDDDNDGVADSEDTDDDCDGVADEEDADTEEEDAEEMEEEDCNGIAEECESSGCEGGGCCSDGCGSEC